MAKDEHGHGSEKRSVGGASVERERDGTYSVYRAGNPHATTGGFKSSDEAAAAALGNGHPKSETVPVHLNAWGQTPTVAKAVRAQLRMDRRMRTYQKAQRKGR